jgi:hypothetical protein
MDLTIFATDAHSAIRGNPQPGPYRSAHRSIGTSGRRGGVAGGALPADPFTRRCVPRAAFRAINADHGGMPTNP